MDKLTESTLNTIDRFSHKLGPVSALLNEIVDRFIPKATVQACSGFRCHTVCVFVRCSHYDSALQHWYQPPGQQCGACIVSICGGC